MMHRMIAPIRRRVGWKVKRSVISGKIGWNTKLDTR